MFNRPSFKSVLLSLTVLVAVCATSVVRAEQKIGVVNLQYALNNVTEGKSAKSALEAEGNQKKQQLTVLENELKKMQEDIQKQRPVLSESALKEKSDQFKIKYEELQKKAMSFEQELKRKEADNVERILGGLRTLVIQTAQRDGYAYVMENSQGAVVYFDKSVTDITNQIIAAYNQNPPPAAKKK